MGANAQTSVPTFTAGDVLTAANMNISARTGVPVFADTTARDGGFGGTGEKTLAEGQLAYIEASNIVQYYDGSAWATLGPGAVAQVKSTTITGTFTTTSTTFVDVTGLSVSITPTSASNKVFVMVTGITGINDAGSYVRMNLVRDSTAIGQSTGGSSTNQTSNNYTGNAGNADSFAMSFLDSPATTSAITYKVQVNNNGSGTVVLGRYAANAQAGAITTITVMEVTP